MLMRFMSNRMVIDTADTLIVSNQYYIRIKSCGIAHPYSFLLNQLGGVQNRHSIN